MDAATTAAVGRIDSITLEPFQATTTSNGHKKDSCGPGHDQREAVDEDGDRQDDNAVGISAAGHQLPESSSTECPGHHHDVDIEIVPGDDGPSTIATFPEGGLRAYLVVLSATFLLLPSFGLMVSIGTLQSYWSTHQLSTYTSRDVGWIPSVFVYLSFSLGLYVGPLFDRYGPRVLAGVGSAMYVVMLFLLAECRVYWQFMLCLGGLGGLGGALITTTGLSTVSHWFKARRGLATGIAMMGNTIGGVVIPILLRATLGQYGWAWAMRFLAFLLTGCLVIGNLFIKGRLKQDPRAKKKSIFSLSIFGDIRFTLLTVSVFGFEICLFGTLGLLPTYASIAGFPASTGFNLIAVLNGASCLGRILPGFVSDKLGPFNVLLIMLFYTLFFMLVLWLPFGVSNLGVLYAFSALFGVGTGSWMALTPVCIGQLCEAEEFGRYYGTLYFVVSLATLVCVPIGGQLVEAVGPLAMVGFFCAVLALSTISFTLSRLACLGWKWKWIVKV